MNQDLEMKVQVKQILKIVQELAPGGSVELRIPPYAAIQCIEGINHRRGTPPNVVEMSAETLIDLTQNPEKWQKFREIGLISASGTNSDLSAIFYRMAKLRNSVEGIINGE
jgi:hypothetical protein